MDLLLSLTVAGGGCDSGSITTKATTHHQSYHQSHHQSHHQSIAQKPYIPGYKNRFCFQSEPTPSVKC